MSDLSPRAECALKALASLTTPYAAPPRNHRDDAGWSRWLDNQPRVFKRTYAFLVADAIEKAGLQGRSRGIGTNPAVGAANTMQALIRRGLAATDGGGVFVSAKWWITPEGARKARTL